MMGRRAHQDRGVVLLGVNVASILTRKCLFSQVDLL